MTNQELLDLLGEVRGEFLLDAQDYREFREEVPQMQVRRISLRKTWLLAAVIVLTLLLVGCTVAYVLSLQDMKVGEAAFTEPAHVDEEGQQIPAAEKTTSLLSLQGIYQPALQEWIAFQEGYDRDKALLIANDRNQSEVPEPYHTAYGCYTWEMVAQLDQIIEKYDLKLLEPYILVQSGEADILFEALKIGNIHREDRNALVEYGSGYFYPEGTFQISADVTLEGVPWNYENYLTIRYSLKEYFDPVYSSVGDIESYVQWDYITQNSTPVLLAMNEESAKICVNLEHAFISVSMDAYAYGESGKVSMPKEALEQIADVLDFTVKPQYADLALVRRMQESAKKEQQIAAFQEEAARLAAIAGGYESYMAYRLETAETAQDIQYSLYDLNGDGTEELIFRDRGLYCHEILTEVQGETFLYFDAGAVTANSEIYPCGEGKFHLYSGYGDFERYKFYEAGPAAVSFLEGVTYSKTAGCWYYHQDEDPWTDDEEMITETKARQVLDRYLLGTGKVLGEPIPGEHLLWEGGVDPYAECITACLENGDGEDMVYTLLDLNGDGTKELLLQGPLRINGEISGTAITLFSQANGELVDLNILPVTHVCSDGYLEYSREGEDGSVFREYIQLEIPGVRLKEILEYDPKTDTWTLDEDGHWGDRATVITGDKAWSVVNSHPRLEPQWKPLEEYPRR